MGMSMRVAQCLLCPAAFRPWVCTLVPAAQEAASRFYLFVKFVIKSRCPLAPWCFLLFVSAAGWKDWPQVLTTHPRGC